MKRREIGAFQLVSRRIDRRQPEMAVGRGPAMAGNMLQDRQHAALLQALGNRRARSPRPWRLGAIGAVANDVVGALDRHVSQRQAVDGDAEIGEIGRDQPGAQPRSRQPERGSTS